MNRREFTRGLASLGLTPALPLQASTIPSAAIASAAADKMYFVGWYTARLNTQCSPDMLVSELNVSRDVAREIFGKLVRTNTVSAPNALGISQTLDPLTDSYLKGASTVLHQARVAKPDPSSRNPLRLPQERGAMPTDEEDQPTQADMREDVDQLLSDESLSVQEDPAADIPTQDPLTDEA